MGPYSYYYYYTELVFFIYLKLVTSFRKLENIKKKC